MLKKSRGELEILEKARAVVPLPPEDFVEQRHPVAEEVVEELTGELEDGGQHRAVGPGLEEEDAAVEGGDGTVPGL